MNRIAESAEGVLPDVDILVEKGDAALAEIGAVRRLGPKK
jgi:hypothetical protein